MTFSSPSFANRSSQIEPILDPSVEPAAYILVDATNGTILDGKNIDEPINVASTGKLVTALAAISTIDRDAEIEVPREAQEVQPMKIGMKVGETWKRDDLLHALLMTSANDAAYALAVAASGSIEEFEKVQKRIASELSMEHSTFGDPSGLDDSQAQNGETQMSPFDLAIAARAVLANPELSKIVASKAYQFVGGDEKPHTLSNHNDKFLNGFEGANGMKTGFTRKSGRTLVASATRGETTLIAAVLDVYQTDAWAATLLEKGFSMIESGEVPEDARTLPAIGVIGSKADVTILIEPENQNETELASSENTNAVVAQSNGGGFLSIEIIAIAVFLILGIAFILRRRAVIKRKKLRRLRAAQMREIQRRSMIDVIDIEIEIEQESEIVKH